MKFWDSSAIVPLLVQEQFTERFVRIYAKDAKLLIWWATEIECAAALRRKEREASSGGVSVIAQAFLRLDELGRHWEEVAPVADVRATARRLARTHPLRAADSLQLAAALVACQGKAGAFDFVTADDRLATAARIEGFRVVGMDHLMEPQMSSYEISVASGVVGGSSSRAEGVAARAKPAAQQAIRAKHRRREGKGKTR